MVELRLEHAGDALRLFYVALRKASAVGIESIGYTQWFERLLTELGHESTRSAAPQSDLRASRGEPASSTPAAPPPLARRPRPNKSAGPPHARRTANYASSNSTRAPQSSQSPAPRRPSAFPALPPAAAHPTTPRPGRSVSPVRESGRPPRN